ncbi:unnamed protein product [Arctia plantaginis]|uniref:Uncharacterized protein n=1 Tax=Arctia plantaginis TaxID=874455 RepID=A0A8S0ZKF2_ARCPL|nr:unnamed protein product [Arctia plantaginis]CAB3254473.1 unnamed protein product [Arctia plantaginis]
MEQVFNDLMKQSKNDVNSLVKWIQDAKLIEATKEGEEKARAMFAGVDQKNVEMAKFKEVVENLASEQHKSFEEFSKQLAEEGPKLMQSAMAGVAALKDKFMK